MAPWRASRLWKTWAIEHWKWASAMHFSYHRSYHSRRAGTYRQSGFCGNPTTTLENPFATHVWPLIDIPEVTLYCKLDIDLELLRSQRS